MANLEWFSGSRVQYIPEYDYKYDKNDALVEAADKGDDALRKLLVVKARELGEVAEMVRDLYNVMAANVERYDTLVLFKGQYGDWTDVNAIRAKSYLPERYSSMTSSFRMSHSMPAPSANTYGEVSHRSTHTVVIVRMCFFGSCASGCGGVS